MILLGFEDFAKMIDIDRIKEKGRLARDLVSKGIATDIEDAYRIIEKEGMVRKSGDDSGIFDKYSEKKTEHTQAHAEKTNQKKESGHDDKPLSEKPGQKAPEPQGFDLSKLESIEKRIERLQNEFGKMMTLFDNLKSYFDTNMDLLGKKLAEIEKQKSPGSEEARSSLPKNEVQKELTEKNKDEPKEKDDQEKEKKYDVSIQNIFNNSNNRMNK
ncbi:MAG TPA: hypothetical protein ENN46_00510 [Candidatus Woesearchaeota archaeon]|nr:hypothetical protein [Candidatus Woesearchaeota archaeon]